jgi:hypothetical protein
VGKRSFEIVHPSIDTEPAALLFAGTSSSCASPIFRISKPEGWLVSKA